MRNIFQCLTLSMFFLLFSLTGHSQEISQSQQVVINLDKQFRSSQRHIPADLLFKIADEKVSKEVKIALAQLSEKDLMQALTNLLKPSLNKGVVENILKLHKIYQNCQGLCQVFKGEGEYVNGLPRDLDKQLASFGEATDKTTRKDEFDFIQYEFTRMIQKFIADNDLYNIRQSAGYYARGDHKNTQVSASLFARGKTDQPYMISAGQEQILHILQTIRFTEREIRFFQEDPSFADVPKEFWSYLRDFRFKGSVKMMPVGTMIQPNEPVMVFTGDPIEVQLIETLVIPIMNYAETVATTGVKIIEASGGKPVADGGARRAPFPTLASYVAYLSGAVGTANSHVARLTKSISNIKNFGTMAHAWVTHFDSEYEAFIEYLKYFNRPGANTLLVDTYDIENGIRNAIRAAGQELQAVRLDSTIAGLNKVETAEKVSALLGNLGYEHVKIGYSDGITEEELSKMESQNIPVDTYLVGTQFASPTSGIGHGWVYKKVERRTVDEKGNVRVTYPMKLAQGKKGIPGGDIQVYRFRDDQGIFLHDIVGVEGEVLTDEEGRVGTPLLKEAMDQGKLKDMPSIESQRLFVKETMASIPKKLKSRDAVLGDYSVTLSTLLENRQNEEAKKNSPNNKAQIGVYFGSFDPVTKAHIELANKAMEMGGFKKIIIIPTGDSSVHGKSNFFPPDVKVEMLKEKFPSNKFQIWTGEAEGKTRYTKDTLDKVQESLAEEHGDLFELTFIGGEDLLESVPSWKEAHSLINNYSWMIFPRQQNGFISLPDEFTVGMNQLSPTYFQNGNHRVEIVDIPIEVTSSTDVKNRINRVDTIFHQVDVQETFWRDAGMGFDGALAIEGSLAITDNVEALAKLAKVKDNIKQTASGDAHLDIEVKYANYNGEFHDPISFPPHGMKGERGAAGNQRIKQVHVFDNVVEVPHHHEILDPRTSEPVDMRLASFNVSAHVSDIMDPQVEVFFEKNGPESYSIWKNPRFEDVYKIVNPDKSKPIFIYGVATDFCVLAAALGFLEKGYNIYIISDAIAGISEEESKNKIDELVQKGAKLVTTLDVFKMNGFNKISDVFSNKQIEERGANNRCKAFLN